MGREKAAFIQGCHTSTKALLILDGIITYLPIIDLLDFVTKVGEGNRDQKIRVIKPIDLIFNGIRYIVFQTKSVVLCHNWNEIPIS